MTKEEKALLYNIARLVIYLVRIISIIHINVIFQAQRDVRKGGIEHWRLSYTTGVYYDNVIELMKEMGEEIELQEENKSNE